MQNSGFAPRRRLLLTGKILLFTLLFFLMASILGMMVYPKSGDTAPRLYYYRQADEAPDVLFLGTSAVFYSVVPTYFEEVSGLTCYNLSTPAQTMQSSCALLVESLREGKKPKTVALYTNIRRFCTERTVDWTYQVTLNLPPSLNQLRLIAESFPPDSWPEAAFKCIRGRENLTVGAILENLRAQYTLDQETDGVPEALVPYIGRGYAYSEEAQDPNRVIVPTWDHFSEDAVSEAAYRRIVSLCRENGIELVLFTVPRLPANIILSGDYDGFHRCMERFAERDGIGFWDLVYVRREHLEVAPEHFMDGYHANSSFAFPFTELLATMFRERAQGTLDLSKYVFDSYDDYLRLHHGINGLYSGSRIYTTKDGRQYIVIRAALGADTGAEYRVTWLRDGEAPAVVSDWSAKDHPVIGNALPAGDYTLRIEARQPGGGAPEQTLEQVFTLA